MTELGTEDPIRWTNRSLAVSGGTAFALAVRGDPSLAVLDPPKAKRTQLITKSVMAYGNGIEACRKADVVWGGVTLAYLCESDGDEGCDRIDPNETMTDLSDEGYDRLFENAVRQAWTEPILVTAGSIVFPSGETIGIPCPQVVLGRDPHLVDAITFRDLKKGKRGALHN